MSLLKDNIFWLKRGRQKSAVARALRKPMTSTEICHDAYTRNPRIRLRDVWLIMQQLQERNLVVCLNPKHAVGKLYALTDLGRMVVEKAYGITVMHTPSAVDWNKYGQVARARIRKMVLLELAAMPQEMPKTAAAIRKSLKTKYPVGLNPTIRALKELAKLGLVKFRTTSLHDTRKQYGLTKMGNTIARQLGGIGSV